MVSILALLMGMSVGQTAETCFQKLANRYQVQEPKDIQRVVSACENSNPKCLDKVSVLLWDIDFDNSLKAASSCQKTESGCLNFVLDQLDQPRFKDGLKAAEACRQSSLTCLKALSGGSSHADFNEVLGDARLCQKVDDSCVQSILDEGSANSREEFLTLIEYCRAKKIPLS